MQSKMAEENVNTLWAVWAVITDLMASFSTTDGLFWFTNVTLAEDIKKNILNVWKLNDWQIRLCYFLLTWTVLNLVGILFAWLRYGKTVTDMYYNRTRTPLKKPTAQNSASDSLEDLMMKKIQ